jgi:glycosyltransferase involved in cell wall biosynthesis
VPFFSVIIPTYNRASKIAVAIDAVLQQSFRDFELIVIDDGSVDDTRNVVAGYLATAGVKYVYQPNKGVSAARNEGARHASGKYLVFLDSDDKTQPNWLYNFYAYLSKSDDDVACCMMKVIDPSGKEKIVSPRRSNQASLGWGIFIPGAFVIKRELFFEIGAYDESLRYGENTELSFRFKKKNIKYGFVDEVGLIYYPSVDGESKHLRNRIVSNEYILQKHKDFFNKNHLAKQQYLQTTAVALARLGQLKEARSFMWKGFLAKPFSFRPLVRLIIVCFPPLAKRVWHVKQ